jgi:formylglycine-generating enzyme required for sulfatase activity
VSRAARIAVLAGAVCACSGSGSSLPPLGQVVVHVDTDAPVPSESSSGTPDWTDPIPLMDRLRVELYPPGATSPCDGCTNEFAVTYEKLAASDVSFGVVPGDASGWVARVRLTVERFELETGDVNPDTTLDTYVALPAVTEGQIVDVSVVLSTDDIGQTLGSLQAPVDPTPGPLGPSLVGTWPDAARKGCVGKPPQASVCVPGGAFWMGASSDHFVPGASRVWHRLVVLSPFWLEATEITVARARGLGIDTTSAIPWSGVTVGDQVGDFCTFTSTPDVRDELPLNCVTWSGAQMLCVQLGGALPTEAQLEYASGGALGQPYPWGFDVPTCEQAVWGRNGTGLYLNQIPTACNQPTNTMAPLGGLEPPGHGTGDHLDLPGGTIFDLAGNLDETAEDVFQFSTDPYWAQHSILRDPRCTQTAPGTSVTVHTLRAGGWTLGGTYLEAGHRQSVEGDFPLPDAGFRCAWKGGG